MADSLVTIAAYDNPMLAHVARGLLEDARIDCILLDENVSELGALAGGFPITSGIRLQVREEDRAEALAVLAEMDTAYSESDPPALDFDYYAAGAVIVHQGKVLVLERPSRDEVRLPKGHVNEGEPAAAAAHREVEEEAGYTGLVILADLGLQEVEFDNAQKHVHRLEHFFLMGSDRDQLEPSRAPEAQFNPIWLDWREAMESLTYEAEREWLRRAWKVLT